MNAKQSSGGGSHQPHRRGSAKKHLTVWATTLLLLLGLVIYRSEYTEYYWNTSSQPYLSPNQETKAVTFSWSHITPSEDLQYHSCHDGLQCARMEVPMDWHDPNETSKIALAIIRRPAQVPITSPNYGGAIITNPGGPGGSGVQQQLSMGLYIQKIVDADTPPESAAPTDLYFDIISFDPRGVNHTTPTISCFPDIASRQKWNLQVEAEGLLGSSETSLRSNWRRARALADGCSRRLMSPKYNRLAEHVNTTPVVRDIVEIVERHGQWREQEASRILHNTPQDSTQTAILARTAWQKNKEPLQYWGFSYGTLIGITFASMYPSRVSRMVLDGVVDAHDYYSGYWKGNLHDTDEILTRFTEYCSLAGPKKCAFHRPGGASAIQSAYDTLLAAIHSDPLSVPGTDLHGPEIITWTDVKLVVKDALYAPLQIFPVLANLLQDLTHGNGSQFATYKRANHASLCRQIPGNPHSPDGDGDGDGNGDNATEPACDPTQNPFSHACVLPGWSPYDASSAILCTDAEPRAIDFSEAEFAAYWAELRDQSHAMGDFWAQTRLACAGWGGGALQAKWRFTGPFGAVSSGEKKEVDDDGGLGYPPLFVGNKLDTVTPVRNAVRMAGLFEGASVLQVDAEGHCSFAGESRCVVQAVRGYFQRGDMPAVGKVCGVERRPLVDVVGVVEGVEASAGGDGDLEEVSRAWSELMLGDGRSML